jgi:hypothetical protein
MCVAGEIDPEEFRGTHSKPEVWVSTPQETNWVTESIAWPDNDWADNPQPGSLSAQRRKDPSMVCSHGMFQKHARDKESKATTHHRRVMLVVMIQKSKPDVNIRLGRHFV